MVYYKIKNDLNKLREIKKEYFSTNNNTRLLIMGVTANRIIKRIEENLPLIKNNELRKGLEDEFAELLKDEAPKED